MTDSDPSTPKRTTPHDAHMAYLNRKLDQQERMLALKEREIVLQERALELRIAEMKQADEIEDSLDELRDSLTAAVVGHGAMHNPSRGRA